MTSLTQLETRERERASPRVAFMALEVALIFIAMWIHAGWHGPDVNEPNYLGKAKHFWQPEWCEGDFFLQTVDAHHAFYWTFGWLTKWMSLSAVAMLGRTVTYALMALAWQRLSWAIVPRRFAAVLSAMLLLTCSGRLHMAGEWFVGGFESKGLAYAFVWFGLAAMVRGRWRMVWPLLGIASALHVVVGVWSIFASALAWWTTSEEADTPRLKEMLPALFCGLVLASPAWVGMLLLNQGTEAELVAQAAEIQVLGRLPHHLDPVGFLKPQDSFPFISSFGWRHLALIAMWAMLSFGVAVEAPLRRLRMFVLGVVVIASIGILIRVVFGEAFLDNARFASQLLRLYWFRMTDSIVPVGASLAAVALVARVQPLRPQLATAAVGVILLVGASHLGLQASSWVEHPYPRADAKIVRRRSSLDSANRFRDWREVCEKVRLESSIGSVFLTPPHNQTFKWYAERGEVVTWKEMPQDAKSVVAWWHRYHDVHRREGRTVSLAYQSPQMIRELGQRYGASFMLTDAEPVADLPVWFRNKSFVVYRLAEPAPAEREPDDE